MFTTMDNGIIEHRSKLTAKNDANLLFVSSFMQWDPLFFVRTWLGKGRKAAHTITGSAHCHSEEENYFTLTVDNLS